MSTNNIIGTEPKELAKFLENKLNDNDFGIIFKVFYYISSFDNNYTLDGGRMKDFIPVYLGNVQGDYRPIRFDISDNSVPLQFIFKPDIKDTIYQIFKSLKKKLVGKTFIYENVIYSFNFKVPTFARLDPAEIKVLDQSEGRFKLSQTSMAVMDTLMSFICADNSEVSMGNNVKYYFVYENANGEEIEEEIQKITSTFANAINIKPFQTMDSETTVSIAEGNSKANSLIFYDNENSYIIGHLLYLAETGKIQNYKIKIKKIYLDGTTGKPRQYVDLDGNLNVFSFTEECILGSLQHTSPIGDVSQITITYSKAANF